MFCHILFSVDLFRKVGLRDRAVGDDGKNKYAIFESV